MGAAPSGPASNATMSGQIGIATSTPLVIDNTGAASGMRVDMAALWTAVVVGCLAIRVM
jgi:hypothetical protein